ncbi:MFS transporter [Altererythrobacter lutimaris]|uniref:MFS transporter n=1 Tax=Altererythrobacter lutimaris TaxID=2743979 RepID=A0A850HAJ0_9SPHN|nr:MFS transporter [Altererythrobacter lutimaris]NVE93488.1 MFS transporter [Altererythrobacter lutimaris]
MAMTIAPETQVAGPAEEKLSVGLKLGWGTGAFGVALLMNGISGVILGFAGTILGLELWLAGAVIFASKLVDVVTDPIVGMWSDKHQSAKGRRRPFLIWGALASAASFALIFTTPVFDNQYVTATYLFGALCLYAFGYTLFNIPYMSMPAEMTDSYHERSSIHAYRMVFIALGALVATSGIKGALDVLGENDIGSWRLVGIVCAALILISLIIAYLTTAKARFTVGKSATAESKLEQLRTESGAVLSNRNFVRLIGVKFSQLMGVQTIGAAMLYFFVQYLQSDFGTLAIFGVIVTASTIIFSPILVQFSKKFGKKNAYFVAAGANIAYALSWTFANPGEPEWAIYLRASIVGIAFGGNVIMAMSMLTDIINEDADRTGVRREGAFTALYSFVEKLTGALAPLIVGIALSYVGFDQSLPFGADQGENVNTALLLAVSWLPSVFNLIAIILLAGYNLTEADVRKSKVQQEFS